ncbi:MAG: hydrogenase formation protein HypD [Promethearchaeota archaeon]
MEINWDHLSVEDLSLSKDIIAKINKIMHNFQNPVAIMHVCGTHEYTIAKNGIRSLLPKNLRVISGPGCPVCVCPATDIDIAVELANRDDVILTTFGDMMRVPSTTYSLLELKARGANIEVVYSPHDAVELAKNNPDKEIVFFAIGFETTAPLIAFEMAMNPPSNFSIICAYKLVPPAMDVLLKIPHLEINGFILPGHVCAIIGAKPFEEYAQRYKSPMVVSGFEVNDMLISIYQIILQLHEKNAKVENSYTRVVQYEGNLQAQSYLEKVFEVTDSFWRGIGEIPNSGYQLREKYQKYDAVKKFDVHVESDPKMPPGCSCSDVLIGKITPDKCALFGKTCTPQHPIGPCMVSHEGACKVNYMFRDI